jgi:acetyltransferase-like isoleucine patch superfamily enzyme
MMNKKIQKLFYRLFPYFLPKDEVQVPSNILSVIKYRNMGCLIGENTLMYGNVVLGRSGKDPISIGKNCVLVNCTILGHDASTNVALNIIKSPAIPVVIEDDCFIGYGAIILMGVTVGKGSIVGAGAIVTSDVSPGTVVAGNPAREICTVPELVESRRALASEHPEYFREQPISSDKSN